MLVYTIAYIYLYIYIYSIVLYCVHTNNMICKEKKFQKGKDSFQILIINNREEAKNTFNYMQRVIKKLNLQLDK